MIGGPIYILKWEWCLCQAEAGPMESRMANKTILLIKTFFILLHLP
jgi:hypothetical protein